MLQCRPAQEFSLGPRALKDALVSTDPALQQLYMSAFSPAERLFLAEAYSPQRTLFCTPFIHTAFDWLLSRPEAPEDFATFHAGLRTRRRVPARKHIYLQPIDLSEGLVRSALLASLQSCTEAFFLGLQVRCLPSVPAASIRCSSRRSQDSDRLQLHTEGILDFLKNSKPGDALCVLGLTLSDLYPCEAWSFTFGTFLPGHEVGICSFARFSGELLKVRPSALDPAGAQVVADDPKTTLRDEGRTLCFSTLAMVQCCKVTCHELCHLLGLGSCRWLRCLMQGVLSLDEALRRPLDLCPICLRKLQHILGFKLVERYKGTRMVWSPRCLFSARSLPPRGRAGPSGGSRTRLSAAPAALWWSQHGHAALSWWREARPGPRPQEVSQLLHCRLKPYPMIGFIGYELRNFTLSS
ncbi:archaelysin family metallopeptidase 1 [Rhinolophus ferrumequinum]|uniref:Archaelysin family metallopeptidase 1 n=1 Tax=Rhinolophus ferrumequinum TaxID=59479 RepID=A0A7J7RWP0_RHIFE|nr:archaelysin family metallopeptidase 1 [Rhinolophus ferrumequinum]